MEGSFKCIVPENNEVFRPGLGSEPLDLKSSPLLMTSARLHVIFKSNSTIFNYTPPRNYKRWFKIKYYSAISISHICTRYKFPMPHTSIEIMGYHMIIASALKWGVQSLIASKWYFFQSNNQKILAKVFCKFIMCAQFLLSLLCFMKILVKKCHLIFFSGQVLQCSNYHFLIGLRMFQTLLPLFQK